MNIIITGGLGFVGSHLVEQLSNEKNKITIFTKSKKKISNVSSLHKNLKINVFDITKKTSLEKNIEKGIPFLRAQRLSV